ncbi:MULTISPECIES: YopX family protein [Bacillus]|uniref:YopX family protein n=1 Tax=Bacillus TaxID=1386 RepID=UPI000A300FC3|nr:MULTISPECIES: YopX family protein [Bacillus cereus group]MBG9520722.1 hypothetical protein [Bacillus thuringiensis]MCC2361627.1 YopX family protein [Bacillus cereus]SME68612.1 YopX protein [Bacillus cereus]
MRQIKYRAWDEQEKRMISWYDKVFTKSNNSAMLCEVPLKNASESYLKYMQYTGLKDSKGAEIYEGDIVHIWEEDSQVPNRDSGGGIIDFDWKEGFSQLGVVSFQGAWYTYETKQHLEGREENIYAPLDFTNDLVVVGNIYENQELLKN